MNRRTRRPNPRARLRRALLVVGVLPALLVLGYALKVGLMLHHNAAGREAFDLGNEDGAAAEFFETRDLNWFEPWIAPFDEGAAHHADGSYGDAIKAYEDALEDVPRREECTVRINLALAHEAVGDQAQADQDTEGAVESWQAGIDVLAAGDCPTDAGRGQRQTDDAAAVDKRLRDKIQQDQQQQQPDEKPPPQQPGPGEQPQDEGEDPRQERLERNNERGRDQRNGEQDLYDDDDYTRPESW